MNRRMKIGLGVAFLIAAALLTSIAVLVRPRLFSFVSGSASHLAAGSWLVAGPFPGHGDNGLYKEYLSRPGEDQARAREGEVATWGLTGVVRWQPFSPSDAGLTDFATIWPAASSGSISYAYTEIESEDDQYAVATIGSGTDVQLRLNGEIVYESRVFRKAELNKDTIVLPLRKGFNAVLVKAQRGLNWKFQWTVTVRPGALSVNNRETIVPDFRIGEPLTAWGQVEVANAGGTRLPDVTVEVLEDGLMLPSRSEIASLDTQEVRRIPIWIATKKSVAAGAGQVVHFRVSTGRDEYRFEIAPRGRDAKTSFVTTYRSTLDGSVQPYSVLLPPTYDARTSYALILLLHGSQVTTWGVNILSYTPKEWAVQVAVHDRGNNDYRDVGEVDIDEVLTDVSKRYRIDPDRMYLSGHSMGGYGTWFLATRYPDRWAAISPQTARTDMSLENPAIRISGTRAQQEFQTRLLQSWSPILFAENLLHLPAYMMHGALDAWVSDSRAMSARLDALGYEHFYDEKPDVGHWWGTRPAHQGTLCVDNPEITNFFLRHNRRPVNPKLVVYKTDNLRYRRAYWIAIDELDDANMMASIRAEVVSPDAIEVQLENISQLTLELNEQLVAVNGPLTVTINGKAAFRGPLNASRHITLRRDSDGSPETFAALDDKSDRSLVAAIRTQAPKGSSHDLRLGGGRAEHIPSNAQPIAKTESLYGPVIDVFNKPFLLVVGSTGAGSEAHKMIEASRRAAQAVARDWMTRCNGVARIKTDLEVTSDDIASSNLILFGNNATNSLIGAINGELPIRFGPTGIIRGEREIYGNDSGFVLIRPNPLNQRKYVVIVGGTTPGSMLTVSRLRFTELPDYVVFDRNTLDGREVAFMAGGFLDKHWQLAN